MIEESVTNKPETSIWDWQQMATDWALKTFGETKVMDIQKRCQRFLEEACELVQSLEMPVDEARKILEYAYGRNKGEPPQEVGGVMMTLAPLCHAAGINMASSAATEIARAYERIDKIREKEATKDAKLSTVIDKTKPMLVYTRTPRGFTCSLWPSGEGPVGLNNRKYLHAYNVSNENIGLTLSELVLKYPLPLEHMSTLADKE